MSLKTLAIAAFATFTLTASDGKEVEDVKNEAPPIEIKEENPEEKKPKSEPNNSRMMYAAVDNDAPHVG